MEYFDAPYVPEHETDDDSDWEKDSSKDNKKAAPLPFGAALRVPFGSAPLESIFSLRKQEDELAPLADEGLAAPIDVQPLGEAPRVRFFSADRDRGMATEDVAKMIHGVPEFAVAAATAGLPQAFQNPNALPRHDAEADSRVLPAPPAVETHDSAADFVASAPEALPVEDVTDIGIGDLGRDTSTSAEASANQTAENSPEPPASTAAQRRSKFKPYSPGGFGNNNPNYYYYPSRYNTLAPLAAGFLVHEHLKHDKAEKELKQNQEKLQHQAAVSATEQKAVIAEQAVLAAQNRDLREKVAQIQTPAPAERAAITLPEPRAEAPVSARVAEQKYVPAAQPQPEKSFAARPAAVPQSAEWRQKTSERPVQFPPQAEAFYAQPHEILRERLAGNPVPMPKMPAAQPAHQSALPTFSPQVPQQPQTISPLQTDPDLHQTAKRKTPDAGLVRAWFWFTVVLIILAALAAGKAFF